MSIRGQGHSVGSNQIMLTLCPLPTHLDTPSERLAFAHSAMAHTKEAPTYPSTLMSDLAAVGRPDGDPVAHPSRCHGPPRRPCATAVQPHGVECAFAREFIVGRGARVVGSFPFPPLSDGMGLSVCAQELSGHPGRRNRFLPRPVARPVASPGSADAGPRGPHQLDLASTAGGRHARAAGTRSPILQQPDPPATGARQ